MAKILITGATGFIGSYMVEEALRQGLEVWAAVRATSSRQYLTDERTHFVELNLESEAALCKQLAGHEFDFVVHAAGVTKCTDAQEFFRINTEGTRHLADALLKTQHRLRRFVYLSSLSVFGPVREEQPYADIQEADTPRPNTAYGLSKLQAEQYLDSLSELPSIILRPTGVYGPRERDYFMMAKSINHHVDFAVGWKKQDITFVYVSDVVQAVMLALTRGTIHRKYFLTDGEVYSSRAFSDLLHHELGEKWLLRVKAPLWLLRIATFAGEHWGRLTHRPTALNTDKYHILSQRNWRCDIRPAMNELGYSPQVKLAEGVRLAVGWYREHHWL